MEQASWSHLPEDVLTLITDKLVFIKDYIRFGVTCLSWHSCFSKNGACLPPQPPLLMIPTKNTRETCSFYSLSDKRVYDGLQVRVPHNHRCIGSSFGWLITVNEESFEVHLVNPFLSINNQIHLPSLSSSKHIDTIGKAILSANPGSSSDYVVMVMYGNLSSLLGFFKAGDNTWTSVEFKWSMRMDAIFYKGQFYGVDSWGSIATCDITSSSPPKIIQFEPFMPMMYYEYKKYIVELCGELLLIRRGVWPDIRNAIVQFQVLKLDPIMCKWVEIESLRGFALFLGDNSSFSLLASDFPGCKPNCIYFENSFPAFNLDDGILEPLFPNDSSNIHSPSIWLQPTLLGCK